MREELAIDERDSVKNIALFVVPVTRALLIEPNRSVDTDLAFAKEKHIAILPLIMEEELGEEYSRIFGTIQYLSKFEQDATSISYSEKLNKYLNTHLCQDAISAKIAPEFNARVF